MFKTVVLLYILMENMIGLKEQQSFEMLKNKNCIILGGLLFRNYCKKVKIFSCYLLYIPAVSDLYNFANTLF